MTLLHPTEAASRLGIATHGKVLQTLRWACVLNGLRATTGHWAKIGPRGAA